MAHLLMYRRSSLADTPAYRQLHSHLSQTRMDLPTEGLHFMGSGTIIYLTPR